MIIGDIVNFCDLNKTVLSKVLLVKGSAEQSFINKRKCGAKFS